MAGRRLALIIGTSQYSDSTLKKLNAPEQDVNGLKKVLENPDIGDFTVKILLNESSCKINQEIEDFFSGDIQKDDFLLIYFSCHGIKSIDGHLYFATIDTITKILRSTSIKSSFVNELMSNCRAQKQVLILDYCYSGAFVKGFTFKTDKEIHTGEYFKVKDIELEDGRGRFVMTASDSMQYALDGIDSIKKEGNDNMYSLFTNTLIKGLETGEADIDGNGLITFDELYEYASSQVKKEVPTQTPRKWGFDTQGKIVISRAPYKSKYNTPLRKFLYGYLEEYELLKPISLPEETWENLIDDIVEKKCIPIIGPETAFLSSNQKLLSLSNRSMIENLIENYGYTLKDLFDGEIIQQNYLLNSTSLLSKLANIMIANDNRPKYYIKKYSNIKMPNFFSEEFKYTPYHFLAKLNLPIYITTNYDLLMEKALKGFDKEPISECCVWNDGLKRYMDSIDSPSAFKKKYEPPIKNPLVYHLNGSVDFPESMVLTDKEFFESMFYLSRDADEVIPAVIRKALLISDLLYIGFASDDRQVGSGLQSLLLSLHGLDDSFSFNVAVGMPSIQSRYKEFNLWNSDNIHTYWGKVSDFLWN